jgi:hemerythrin-like domain-containing protein
MRGEERRISSQHKQLGDLFERVMASLEGGGPRLAVGDFLLFATALEAHLSVEEEIYFPALHGLRNDVGSELVVLVEEHQLIREALPQVRQQLATDDREAARIALDTLANQIERHEHDEESLLARITEGPVSSFGHSNLEEEV